MYNTINKKHKYLDLIVKKTMTYYNLHTLYLKKATKTTSKRKKQKYEEMSHKYLEQCLHYAAFFQRLPEGGQF